MDNRPEKKTDQARLIDLQMNVAGKAKIFDILTIATLLIVVFGFAITMFIIPKKTFSDQENRALQQFPSISSSPDKFNLDNLVNGNFTAGIAKFYEDQFPLRDTFVGLKGIAEIALQKKENDGVILGKDDYLITKDPYPDFAQVQKNIDNISTFADTMYQMKVPVTLAVAGRTVDAMAGELPGAYPLTNSINLWNYFNTVTGMTAHVQCLNLLDPLKKIIDSNIANGNKTQLYYRTDHHWTTLGAYYAYCEILKSFREDKFDPQPLSAFNIEDASDSFYGTTWSKAGMKWIKPDTINYYRYAGDEDFVTTIVDTGKSFDGFYDRSYLDVKDKYSSFIGGNNARVDITKKPEALAPDEKRPKLLIIKDSFAHSVAPFLAYHYDLVIFDLRYFRGSIAKIVFDENISRVLFLYNMENFMGDNVFEILNSQLDTTLHDYIMAQYPIKNIYINSNPISDYSIVCNSDADSTTAAQSLQSTILEKMGLTLNIVTLADGEDYSSYTGKAIILTDQGLPAPGLMEITTEGDNLVFRCNLIATGASYSVGQFIDKYLKNATGSFNFGPDFVFNQMVNKDVVIKPAL
ncbi:MAG: DHHW family protein [Oscillospiraceae bacterium]|nr:DHHW family protein [Oscillospiraceae bacterium]